MLKSLLSAFLMYSRIPVPQIAWKEENRRYALGWFPLIGAVTGLMLLLWRLLCDLQHLPQMLFAAGAVCLPVCVTGGIHLDGYCDVTDALASCADREKKLAIMSDPHIGSFAVIRVCLYLIVQTALLTELVTLRDVCRIGCGLILSRALSGLSAVTFRGAKKDGTLQSFVRPSHRNVTTGMCIGWMLLSCCGICACGLLPGLLMLAAAAAVFVHYRASAYKHFGGITGDLCGWFLQRCELAMLTAAVLGQSITEVFA
ncbi:MAG: adenosylcobinamide-GDP ribazoletransferase [Oscillospiraceae bacterium]|nr:adenosylcobinamide-GDP ribazoletransferase [Oscillospiraceae bacterium]